MHAQGAMFSPPGPTVRACHPVSVTLAPVSPLTISTGVVSTTRRGSCSCRKAPAGGPVAALLVPVPPLVLLSSAAAQPLLMSAAATRSAGSIILLLLFAIGDRLMAARQKREESGKGSSAP